MTQRTRDLMLSTPIKSTQIAQKFIADDIRANRPGMKWVYELERARLLTESYKQTEGEPMVLRRAKALAYILEHMTLYIRPGELIVGCFASGPDSCAHYPELQYKWVERETGSGMVYSDLLNDEEKKELKEIDSYWEKYAVHHIFNRYLPADLLDVTFMFGFEYQTPNYEKILHKGLKGLIEEALNRKERLVKELWDQTISEVEYVKKKDFLDSTIIVLNAAINWGKRFAKLAREMSEKERDPKRKGELRIIAENCEWVPKNPARTLREAIQCYWFIHLIVNYIELPCVGDGIRFDVCMNPFYEKDLKEGRITREDAQELVECVFVKSQETGFLHPPIWSGTGGGALGFQTMTIGGMDANGDDVSGEMSLIVMDAMKTVRTITPPLALRWHDKMPKKLIDKSIECWASGMPQPALFNDKVNILRLAGLGIPIEEAKNYSILTCMIPTIPGKNLTRISPTYIPVPLCLTAALGLDVLPGFWKRPVGNPVPDLEKISSIEQLMDATIENYKWIMHAWAIMSNIGEALYREYVPRPFLSALLDDSIEKAQDFREWQHWQGYREVYIIGLNNLADSLAAIKKVVFENKKATLSELIQALKKNWEGYEELRQMCLEAPKFGNDDDSVDLLSREMGKRIAKETTKFKTIFGSHYITDGTVASAFYLHGATCPATPDGRKAREPFHDGSISPMGSRDHKGPTAVLKSVSKVDPLVTWNHLFNQTFMPQYLVGHNAELFAQYLDTWNDLGIHHIQFSVVSRETLIDAQKHPDKYSDLMVRVCGYSAYFVDLNKGLQDQIISRTPQCL